MDRFDNVMRKRLQEKRMLGQGVGAYVLNHLRQYCKFPDTLGGYIKNSTLLLKMDPREDKTRWFHKRIDLCKEVNEKLMSSGYENKITLIRVQ